MKQVSHRAKLKPAAVRRIRKLLDMKTPQDEIAAKFGISQSAVSMIARGLTYKHVKAA